jgi:hypothetical protein
LAITSCSHQFKGLCNNKFYPAGSIERTLIELAIVSRQPLSEFKTLSAEQVSTIADVVNKYHGN